MQWICQLNHARAERGERIILDDISLSLLPGAKIGVIGANGSGKSTLLQLLAGTLEPSRGDARWAPAISVGMLPQEPVLDETTTVVGNVRSGVSETVKLLARYDTITARLTRRYSDALLNEMNALQEQLDDRDAWGLDSRLEQAMAALRCPPPNNSVRGLSGGERRRVALCRLLLQRPHLLLLDEPTSHLDAESVQWLEQHLATYLGTVVAVTHDRYFLDNVAEWILELDRGGVHSYAGNYTNYLETKAVRLKVQGLNDAAQLRQLQQELDWTRCGVKARQEKSGARLRRYEQMASRAGQVDRRRSGEIRIPPGPRLGSMVIEARHVSKSVGGRELFRNLSFTLPRNGIVGVVGPNGVGKTTLFEMITGADPPDVGSFEIGESVRIAYVDQKRASIDPDRTAWEIASEGRDVLQIGTVEVPSRSYLAAFGFRGADQQKPARRFSGGERNRLNLALTFKQGGNVLLLDEPTNDLDTATLTSLENAIGEFPGCVMVTAHDRWFLDRVATHILAWEGTESVSAHWYWFEGNFASYEHNKVDRLGLEAVHPHSMTHRRLTRD